MPGITPRDGNKNYVQYIENINLMTIFHHISAWGCKYRAALFVAKKTHFHKNRKSLATVGLFISIFGKTTSSSASRTNWR
jgi:hypothetical protein